MIPSRLHVYFSRQELKVSWGFDYKLKYQSKALIHGEENPVLAAIKILGLQWISYEPFPTSKRVKPKEKKTTPALTLTLR